MNTTVVVAEQGNAFPVPSVVFSAVEIAELVLGMIGSFSVNDDAPDPVALNRTLKHMEVMIAEVAGTEMCQWLIDETYRFLWPVDVQSDTLSNVMGSLYPPLGIVLPIAAYLVDSNGVRVHELPIVRRHKFETIDNKLASGQPELLYFSRSSQQPTVSIYRVPDSSMAWYIDLVAQTYAPSVIGKQYQTDQSGNLHHQFGREWQRWLIYQLAADVGNGPVMRVALQYVNSWQEKADAARARLEGWSNREKKSTPSRTRRWGS